MVNLKEALKYKIQEQEIPSSYDIVGEIAVFSKLPDNIKKQKLIANTLLEINKNIKTVLFKVKQFSGKYRLPKFKILAGKKTKEAIYRENNSLFKLNLEKCYFSQRLANERLRIAKQVKFNETILVMFSGIGIYPIVLSRNSKAKEIYAIEINPFAHNCALENLKLNKITNIKLFKGDVKKVLPKIKLKFNRILMPAPKNAEQYLNLIKNKINKKTIIHFYDFSQEKDFPSVSINKIKKIFKRIRILNKAKCGTYSPYTYRICIDFQVL
jgi:tRNA (guanine37-N1)-methyltransferase